MGIILVCEKLLLLNVSYSGDALVYKQEKRCGIYLV